MPGGGDRDLSLSRSLAGPRTGDSDLESLCLSRKSLTYSSLPCPGPDPPALGRLAPQPWSAAPLPGPPPRPLATPPRCGAPHPPTPRTGPGPGAGPQPAPLGGEGALPGGPSRLSPLGAPQPPRAGGPGAEPGWPLPGGPACGGASRGLKVGPTPGGGGPDRPGPCA